MSRQNLHYHDTLAYYFRIKPYYYDLVKKKPNIRKVVELPWQQIKGHDLNNLEGTLTDIDFFFIQSNFNRLEIWGYWQHLPKGQHAWIDKYNNAIIKWHDLLGDTAEYDLLLNELAHFFYFNGAQLQSVKIIEESLRTAKFLYHKDDIRIAIRKSNYATTLLYLGEYDLAETLFREALTIFISEYGPNVEKTWALREGLAICFVNTNKIDEGICELKNCMEYNINKFGRHHLQTLISFHNLADAYKIAGYKENSKKYYREAFNGFLKQCGANHPYTKSCAKELNDIKCEI